MLNDFERIDKLEERVLNLESELNRVINQVDVLVGLFQDTLDDAIAIIEQLGDVINELDKKIPGIRSKVR